MAHLVFGMELVQSFSVLDGECAVYNILMIGRIITVSMGYQCVAMMCRIE